jgi:lipopolysaccharide biosynthesis regulator YciM
LKAALKEAQDEAFSDGITRIKGNVTKAVDVLVELLESEDNQIRIRAAENVIEYAVKLNHNEELDKRINDLEERLKEQR